MRAHHDKRSMELDAKRFTDGTTLDTDICIVGAGPAGLVIASELVDRQCDVILLESGGSRAEPEILALNVGDTSGDVYAGLGPTRHRQVGGTTQLWNSAAQGAIGAKYAPLDAADFEVRPGLESQRLAVRAGGASRRITSARSAFAGSGRSPTTPTSWAMPNAIAVDRSSGDDLVSRVYQFGARDSLIAPLRASIARATNVRLCSHATAIGLDTQRVRPTSRRPFALERPVAPRWTVRAKRIVLAAGAVENARLLLLLSEARRIARNGTEWVGRGFMEHPRDHAITLRPHSHAPFARRGLLRSRIRPKTERGSSAGSRSAMPRSRVARCSTHRRRCFRGSPDAPSVCARCFRHLLRAGCRELDTDGPRVARPSATSRASVCCSTSSKRRTPTIALR